MITLNITISTSWYVTSHPGQLSLAIPPWVGAVRAGKNWGVNSDSVHASKSNLQTGFFQKLSRQHDNQTYSLRALLLSPCCPMISRRLVGLWLSTHSEESDAVDSVSERFCMSLNFTLSSSADKLEGELFFALVDQCCLPVGLPCCTKTNASI